MKLPTSAIFTALTIASISSPVIAAEQLPYFENNQFLDPRQNLAQYFVEARCDDPTATDIDQDCEQPHARGKSMVVTWRLADWGSNGVPYYQIAESYIGFGPEAPIVQTWSYPPLGKI